MPTRVSKTELFASLPAPWPDDLRPRIREIANSPSTKLVVLDDDPTGTQTVYGISVLTVWDAATLDRAFTSTDPCFYVLTNSRAFPPGAAAQLIRGLARALADAARRNGRTFIPISRSDSTLRGHFPLEIDILEAELGPFDATVIIPYFEAGGRYTVHDIHYVADGDQLVPAAETPFAADAAFGYRNSNLRDYIAEKSRGRIPAGSIDSFHIAELRTAAAGEEATANVTRRLLGLPRGGTAIVNACHPRDLEFFSLGALLAERAGGRFLYHTAAQFVAARLGLDTRPPWTPVRSVPLHPDLAGSMEGGITGGLVVVGSHVSRTTEQLLRVEQSGVASVCELSVDEILGSAGRDKAIAEVRLQVEERLKRGQDVVLATSRKLVSALDAVTSLEIAQRVSAALVEIVRGLSMAPRYLVAKGGITASDLATQALGVRQALVQGQILPGVPVWELGAETRFPGLPYIVFPGNVGGPEALVEVIRLLTQK